MAISLSSRTRKTSDRRSSVVSIEGYIEKAKKLVHRPRHTTNNKAHSPVPSDAEQPTQSTFRTPVDLSKPINASASCSKSSSSTLTGSSNSNDNSNNSTDITDTTENTDNSDTAYTADTSKSSSTVSGSDEKNDYSVIHTRRSRPSSLVCQYCSYFIVSDAFQPCQRCSITFCQDCASLIFYDGRTKEELAEIERTLDFRGIYCDCDTPVPEPFVSTSHHKPRKTADYYEDTTFQMPPTPNQSRRSEYDFPNQVMVDNEMETRRYYYPEEALFERKIKTGRQGQMDAIERASTETETFEEASEGVPQQDDDDDYTTETDFDLGTETDFESDTDDTEFDDALDDVGDINDINQPTPKAKFSADCQNCGSKICQGCKQICHPGFLCSGTPDIDPMLAGLLEREGIRRWPKCLEVVRRIEGETEDHRCNCRAERGWNSTK